MKYFHISCLVFFIYLRNICGFDIIELNYDLGPHSPFYPIAKGNTTFKSNVQEKGYTRGFWLAYSEITTQTFLSTWLGAPYAFYEFGITVDQIPFRDLFATAAVIDVREKVAKNGFYLITVSDIKDWIKKNGMFPKHCIVLFNSGWDVGRYPDEKAYFQAGSPAVPVETLKFILSFEVSHGIHFVGFGIDFPYLDGVEPKSRPSIGFIGKAGKYIVVHMKELGRLPPKGAKMMVMPMKIKGIEEAPARVAARIPYN